MLTFLLPRDRQALWGVLKSAHRLAVSVEEYEKTRSLEQNSKLHALLTRISKRKKWAGQWRDVDDWKRLMTAAWLRTRGEKVEFVPAVDGQGFDVLYRRTSKMNVKEMIELIEYVTAWMVDNDVSLYDGSEAA